MEQMLNVSSNPHVRDKMTTGRIMQLVVLALLPTTLFGIWNFGFRAFLVVLVTVASSVFFEWLYDRLMHKKNTTTDFSAVVTGLLLALNMPPQIPIWMPIPRGRLRGVAVLPRLPRARVTRVSIMSSRRIVALRRKPDYPFGIIGLK